MRALAPASLALLLLACGGPDDDTGKVPITEPGTTDSATTTTATPPTFAEVSVSVTLDGVPVEGALVSQGGGLQRIPTDAAGQALLPLDASIPGDVFAIAAHPDARTKAAEVDAAAVSIALASFDRSDNPAYVFQHPGTPDDRADNSKCGHCHITIDDDWSASVHRQAASNPAVHDVYAGTASSYTTEPDCLSAGGQWWEGLVPGTAAPGFRCYLGGGTLPDLNPDCGVASPCDGQATETGACADCHAPGIDGQLGGRDLLEATGHAYEFGVHCDVCHKVESVDLAAPAGVGGRLHLVRPSEPDVGGTFEELTFGPWGDTPNPRMGAVQRDHYQDTTLCAGCHQHDQPVLVPGESADAGRWPTGLLPVHSTWDEWAAGPMNPGAPCQSCHMPPAPEVGNAADLYNVFEPIFPEGIASGWPRVPGSVRRHVWVGPRSPDVQDMLGLAASVQLGTRWEGDEWIVDASVSNVGCGHAIPTGEPSRNLLLVVEASCQGAPLPAVGGDVLPDYAGALDVQDGAGDWAVWPGAQPGDVIRVVARPGGFVDYTGTGPFGDGTFDAIGKGVPVEVFAGQSTITAVNGDVVTLDAPLPPGDLAYRVPPASLPVDGAPLTPLAGAPGVGFARVLADASGTRMVPHHAAVDVVSDHRLLPQQTWLSEHRFDGTGCATPEVRAVLVHRAFPWGQAVERGWVVSESVMTEVVQ